MLAVGVVPPSTELWTCTSPPGSESLEQCVRFAIGVLWNGIRLPNVELSCRRWNASSEQGRWTADGCAIKSETFATVEFPLQAGGGAGNSSFVECVCDKDGLFTVQSTIVLMSSSEQVRVMAMPTWQPNALYSCGFIFLSFTSLAIFVCSMLLWSVEKIGFSRSRLHWSRLHLLADDLVMRKHRKKKNNLLYFKNATGGDLLLDEQGSKDVFLPDEVDELIKTLKHSGAPTAPYDMSRNQPVLLLTPGAAAIQIRKQLTQQWQVGMEQSQPQLQDAANQVEGAGVLGLKDKINMSNNQAALRRAAMLKLSKENFVGSFTYQNGAGGRGIGDVLHGQSTDELELDVSIEDSLREIESASRAINSAVQNIGSAARRLASRTQSIPLSPQAAQHSFSVQSQRAALERLSGALLAAAAGGREVIVSAELGFATDLRQELNYNASSHNPMSVRREAFIEKDKFSTDLQDQTSNLEAMISADSFSPTSDWLNLALSFEPACVEVEGINSIHPEYAASAGCRPEPTAPYFEELEQSESESECAAETGRNRNEVWLDVTEPNVPLFCSAFPADLNQTDKSNIRNMQERLNTTRPLTLEPDQVSNTSLQISHLLMQAVEPEVLDNRHIWDTDRFDIHGHSRW